LRDFFNTHRRYHAALLEGTVGTLKICVLVWAVGILLGIALGVTAARAQKTLGRLIYWGSFAVSSIPALVILFWFHFPAQALLGIVVDPFWTACFVLAVINTVAVAEAVRAGVLGLPKEMTWTARAAGIPDRDIYARILLPLGIRSALPAIVFAQVIVVHMSIFASLISVNELFRTVQTINALEYQPIESYSILALFFIALCVPLGLLGIMLRGKLDFGISRSIS